MYAICCQGRNGCVSRFELKRDPDELDGISIEVFFDSSDYIEFHSLEDCEFFLDNLTYFFPYDEFIYIKL